MEALTRVSGERGGKSADQDLPRDAGDRAAPAPTRVNSKAALRAGRTPCEKQLLLSPLPAEVGALGLPTPPAAPRALLAAAAPQHGRVVHRATLAHSSGSTRLYSKAREPF